MMVKSPLHLVFTDFVDLQTRVVLLPRIEEEGRGAVVASFTPLETLKNDSTNACSNECPSEDPAEESNDESSKQAIRTSSENADIETEESMEDVDLATEVDDDEPSEEVPELCSSSSQNSGDHFEESNPQDEAVQSCDETQKEDGEEDSSKESDSKPVEKTYSQNEQDVVGLVLVGIENETKGDDWSQKDFTEILASIRDAPTPIVLLLEPAMDMEQNLNKSIEKPVEDEEDADTSTESSASDCEQEHPAKQPEADTTARNLFAGRFSSWSSRAAQMAAEAASGAASLSNKVAIAASERANREQTVPEPPKQRPPCRMFIQLSSGKFAQVEDFPLVPGSPSPVSGQKVSTSSVLLIRLSAETPCPAKTYQFQWYRSCGDVPVIDDRSRSSHGSRSFNGGSPGSPGRKSIGSNSGHVSVQTDSEVEWSLLSGATHAAYQPSATDVGHRLRCVITASEYDYSDDHSESNSDCTREEICELPQRVSADMSLFNAARQNLGHGAKFGNLLGRGNAEGRRFLVQIEISRCDRKMASALKIFQISGSTAESIHEGVDAFFNASAVSHPSRPKCFGIVFPKDPPDSASMVSALSTDGRFELEAPNRITRETLLLALGIANYKGRPADLDTTTVLYPCIPPSDEILKDSLVDSLGEISISGSFVSAISKDGSNVGTPRKDGSGTGSPVGSVSTPSLGNYDCNDRMQQLEEGLHSDLKNMLKKLARKDKAVSDLQRQLTMSDSQLLQKEMALEKSRKEHENTSTCLKLAERRIETQKADYKRLKGDYEKHVSSLESRIQGQAEKMAEMEKMIRSLQNEKAVLSAAVDARDSKLVKMEDLQSCVTDLKAEVSKKDALCSELNDMEKKYRDVSANLEMVSKTERDCREQLQKTRGTVDTLTTRLQEEQKKAAACQSQFGSLRTEAQKYKAERNSLKQKADSLAKEVARICRNGLTIADVERIVQDEESRRTEVSLLRAQKRKALEELDIYRTAFDQSVAAQSKSGIDVEAVRALEQKAELERVVAELTEYVNAKEMQLETVKQVNQSLQEELQAMAKVNMENNEL